MLNKITKQVLPLLLVLGFTACDERQPGMQHTTASNISDSIPTHTIEKEEPDILTPKTISDDEVVNTYTKSSTSISQTFTGGIATDGLDIGNIRLGLDKGKTRLVFDSYKWDINTKVPHTKASQSGHYDFKYDTENRRITAVVSGYRGFSALTANKPRLFTTSNMVEKIYLETHLDDSGYKFTIQLKQNAQVNVFELKEPGRIIVDISPL